MSVESENNFGLRLACKRAVASEVLRLFRFFRLWTRQCNSRVLLTGQKRPTNLLGGSRLVAKDVFCQALAAAAASAAGVGVAPPTTIAYVVASPSFSTRKSTQAFVYT